MARVDRNYLEIWIWVFDADSLLDVQSIGMLGPHTVPESLSVQVPKKVHRHDVLL